MIPPTSDISQGPSTSVPSDVATVSRPSRDPALDGLRGIAVLLVFVFHYGGGLRSHNPLLRLFGYVTAAGWTGVTLFFALSGFLITGVLWDSIGEPRWLTHFYFRRILRVFPLYFATLALAVVVTLATGKNFLEILRLWPYFVFLQNVPGLLNLAHDVSYLPLYHYWSLAVEEQFYLIWPFLLALFSSRLGGYSRRKALTFCIGAALVSVVFCAAIFGLTSLVPGDVAESFNSFLLTHCGALALGGALAIILKTDPDSYWRYQLNKYLRPVFLSAVALYLFSSVIGGTFTLRPRLQFVIGLPAVATTAVCAIAFVLKLGWPRRLASFTPLRFMGRISYGFYIFHVLLQPVFDLIATHFTHATSGNAYLFVRLAAAFSITLAVAWLSFTLFESPLLRLKRFFPVPVRSFAE